MTYYSALGYDLTFKEYRGCNIMSASSHLWNFKGELSPDSAVMIMNCEGPNMVSEGTAQYRFVIEIVDENHRIQTFSCQQENGEWAEFSKSHYTRV